MKAKRTLSSNFLSLRTNTHTHMHMKHLTGINYLHNNLHTNIALKGNANRCVPYHQVAPDDITETKSLGKCSLIGKVKSC